MLTIPATTTAITAACYTAIQSEDPASGDPQTDDDFLQVWFWDQTMTGDAQYPFVFVLATEGDAPLDWGRWEVALTPAEVAPLVGRQLAFEAYSFVNDVYPTNFFLDSCTLKVTYCK
jgi:hypothetical protein